MDGSSDKIKAIPLVERKPVKLGRKSSSEDSTQTDGVSPRPRAAPHASSPALLRELIVRI